MPTTFKLTLAYNSRLYGDVEIEAETPEEALELIRQQAILHEGVWEKVDDYESDLCGSDYTIVTFDAAPQYEAMGLTVGDHDGEIMTEQDLQEAIQDIQKE